MGSLVRAIKSMGLPSQIEIISDGNGNPSKPNLLMLPGVGNFGAAMEQLRNRNLDVYIENCIQNGVRVMGICLGMQLLLSDSEESPGSMGLNIVPGSVRRLCKSDDRVPNVGWNQLIYNNDIYRSYDLGLEANFYFTHSFFADLPQEFVVASSRHGNNIFPAVISNSYAMGIQFHPEKSGSDGIRFLKGAIESQIH